jgi:hypothetical protein
VSSEHTAFLYHSYTLSFHLKIVWVFHKCLYSSHLLSIHVFLLLWLCIAFILYTLHPVTPPDQPMLLLQIWWIFITSVSIISSRNPYFCESSMVINFFFRDDSLHIWLYPVRSGLWICIIVAKGPHSKSHSLLLHTLFTVVIFNIVYTYI